MLNLLLAAFISLAIFNFSSTDTIASSQASPAATTKVDYDGPFKGLSEQVAKLQNQMEESKYRQINVEEKVNQFFSRFQLKIPLLGR